MYVRAIWLALAAIGLAQAGRGRRAGRRACGPFTGPLAGNRLANHEGTRACVEEELLRDDWGIASEICATSFILVGPQLDGRPSWDPQ